MLIAIGLVAGLVASEALLQAGAAVVRLGRREVSGSRGEDMIVLCLGDSNTYGLYVDEEQAWPRQLEAAWRAAGRPPRLEVINGGFPGMNSSRIRNLLPQVIEDLRPAVVLLMVGANDLWTQEEPPREERASISVRLWRYSRLYRLFYMLVRAPNDGVESKAAIRSLHGPEDMSPGALRRGTGGMRIGPDRLPLGWQRVENVEATRGWEYRLEANLGVIARAALRARVRLAFVTYPADWGTYKIANEHVRIAAEVNEVSLIDVAAEFDAACPHRECSDLFFADWHPRAKEYARVAEIIRGRLPAILPGNWTQ